MQYYTIFFIQQKIEVLKDKNHNHRSIITYLWYKTDVRATALHHKACCMAAATYIVWRPWHNPYDERQTRVWRPSYNTPKSVFN